MIKELAVWMIVAELAIASPTPALAQTASECQRDPCEHQPTGGEWHGYRNDVVQTANVNSSSKGVTAKIEINRAATDNSASPGFPGGQIAEIPRGGQQYVIPGISIPGGRNPGTPPLLPSTGGANEIVGGGPLSLETGAPGQPPRQFGGVAIGGWTYDTPATPGVTTPFAPVGPVPHIDARALAVQAEAEFPVPSITLKVNPDPGRVNVDSWFWAAGYDGRVLSYSKTQHASHTVCRLLLGISDCHSVDDSVTVVVHLTPRHYQWTFGDDRNNVADFNDHKGLGTAYVDPDPRDASPVAHAYHWSSFNFFGQGGYPIQLAIDWSAAFSANGGGFQGIPDVNHAFDGRHQVRQVVSILDQ